MASLCRVYPNPPNITSTPPARVVPVLLAGAALGVACGQASLEGTLWWLLPLLCGIVLVILLRWTPTLVTASIFVATAMAGSAIVAGVASPYFRGGAVVYTMAAGGTVSGTVLAAVAVRATRRLQKRELHHARELARSVAAERDAHIAAALAQERATLAGQIHDQLGHRLTLSTVRLGRFGLDGDLTDEQRRTIAAVRDETADITAELGSLVQMLDRGSRDTMAGRTPTETVVAARAAGLDIVADLTALLESGPKAMAVMSVVLDEAVANAARHAPGAPVTIDTTQTGDGIRVTVSNPRSGRKAGPAGAGTGLARVGDRVRASGGQFEVSTAGSQFTVVASLP